MSSPADRLAKELPGRGCREVLALLYEARSCGRAMWIAIIEVDASGKVELMPLRRFSREQDQALTKAGE